MDIDIRSVLALVNINIVDMVTGGIGHDKHVDTKLLWFILVVLSNRAEARSASNTTFIKGKLRSYLEHLKRTLIDLPESRAELVTFVATHCIDRVFRVQSSTDLFEPRYRHVPNGKATRILYLHATDELILRLEVCLVSAAIDGRERNLQQYTQESVHLFGRYVSPLHAQESSILVCFLWKKNVSDIFIRIGSKYSYKLIIQSTKRYGVKRVLDSL